MFSVDSQDNGGHHSISIACEFVRKAVSQASTWTCESDSVICKHFQVWDALYWGGGKKYRIRSPLWLRLSLGFFPAFPKGKCGRLVWDKPGDRMEADAPHRWKHASLGMADHRGAPPTCNSLTHNGSKSLKDARPGGLRERETYNTVGTLWPSTSRALLLPDSVREARLHRLTCLGATCHLGAGNRPTARERADLHHLLQSHGDETSGLWDWSCKHDVTMKTCPLIHLFNKRNGPHAATLIWKSIRNRDSNR